MLSGASRIGGDGATLHLKALLASACKVPLFALFDFIASQLSIASWANNAKSGTGVVDAATRSSRAALHLCRRRGNALRIGGCDYSPRIMASMSSAFVGSLAERFSAPSDVIRKSFSIRTPSSSSGR